MTFHTESHCAALHDTSRVDMIRAIHAAHIQLTAAMAGTENLDHAPAIAALADCLGAAGHPGFAAPEDKRAAEDKAREVRTDKGIESITVRFFGMQTGPDGDLDIVEMTESEFVESGGIIEYERHTIFDNGARQVCLTTDEIVSDFLDDSELFLSDERGNYIPRDFSKIVDRSKVWGVDADQWAILEAGPDHDFYWDAWVGVLDFAVLTKDDGTRWALYQDGDLWLIPSN